MYVTFDKTTIELWEQFYLSEYYVIGCLKEGAKLKAVKGKRKSEAGMKCVQCLAISTDGKFLVRLYKLSFIIYLHSQVYINIYFLRSKVAGDSGCKHILVFCGDTLNHIKNLQGHRDSVTSLVFRRDTHTLYSGSNDRSVKVWNLGDMAYVESLWVYHYRCHYFNVAYSIIVAFYYFFRFGHQSGVTSIDALARERAISSGGFDGTIRIWKIVEESQLIFNGHGGSIDTVKLINEEHFFSCGDDGQLCVWGCLKKKPLCSVPDAHGRDKSNNQPMWISSIATLLNTDLVASGIKYCFFFLFLNMWFVRLYERMLIVYRNYRI